MGQTPHVSTLRPTTDKPSGPGPRWDPAHRRGAGASADLSPRHPPSMPPRGSQVFRPYGAEGATGLTYTATFVARFTGNVTSSVNEADALPSPMSTTTG